MLTCDVKGWEYEPGLYQCSCENCVLEILLNKELTAN